MSVGRVSPRGAPGREGGPPGDLFVRVKVRDHALFGRSGSDLTLDLPITFTEVAVGGQPDSLDFYFSLNLGAPHGFLSDGPFGNLAMGFFPDDVNANPLAGDIVFDDADIARERKKTVSEEHEFLVTKPVWEGDGTRVSREKLEADLDLLEHYLVNCFAYLKIRDVDYRAALDAIRLSLEDETDVRQFELQRCRRSGRLVSLERGAKQAKRIARCATLAQVVAGEALALANELRLEVDPAIG